MSARRKATTRAREAKALAERLIALATAEGIGPATAVPAAAIAFGYMVAVSAKPGHAQELFADVVGLARDQLEEQLAIAASDPEGRLAVCAGRA